MAIYSTHEIFEGPKDFNSVIWRYMSFSKFISLLNSSSLYFTVPNKFEDKWEGTIPIKNKELINEQIVSFFESARSTHAVNCWHMKRYESATMWKNYTNNNEGIAIKSTFSRLSQCFIKENQIENNEARVFIGKVKYIDFNLRTININNGLSPLLYKRKYFNDENEIRAVIDSQFLSNLFIQGLPGINVPVNLEILIQQIYVSPIAEIWFYNLIKSICDGRFEIKKSSIDEIPPMTTNDKPLTSFVHIKKADKENENNFIEEIIT